jgi:delta 1-pyrroline-5-carboxylate dehydrogenase
MSDTKMASSSEIKLRFDTFYNIIDGSPVSTTQTRHGINPATKQANPDVPVASQQDLNSAVEAAQRAFKHWSQTTMEERRAALVAYANAYKELTSDFAKLLTMEQGKPVSYPFPLFLQLGSEISRRADCICYRRG